MNIVEVMPELLLRIWMMFTNPLWLIALIPVMLGLVWRFRANYMSKTITPARKQHIGTRLRFVLPRFFAFFVLLALVGALADVTRSYTVVEDELSVNRLLVLADSSGSMYESPSLNPPSPPRRVTIDRPQSTAPQGLKLTCTSKELFKEPRIKAVCYALHELVGTLRIFSKTENIESEMGLIQFAADAFVISYPLSDYDKLDREINVIVWNDTDNLGQSTNLHYALYDLFLMALDRNFRKDTEFTSLNVEDRALLRRALAAGGPLYLPKELASKFARVREEMRDTAFMIITDANLSLATLDSGRVSFSKLIELARFLEIPIHIISVEKNYPQVARLVALTGTPEHSGSFVLVRYDRDFEHLAELANTILKERLSQTTLHPVERRESYAPYFIGASLLFVLICVFFRKTISRSLTD